MNPQMELRTARQDHLERVLISGRSAVTAHLAQIEVGIAGLLSPAAYAQTRRGIWPPTGQNPVLDKFSDALSEYMALEHELYEASQYVRSWEWIELIERP